MKDSLRLNIKVFSCVFTAIFIIFALVDFGSLIEWRNDVSVPSHLFQIIYAGLLCRESFPQV